MSWTKAVLVSHGVAVHVHRSPRRAPLVLHLDVEELGRRVPAQRLQQHGLHVEHGGELVAQRPHARDAQPQLVRLGALRGRGRHLESLELAHVLSSMSASRHAPRLPYSIRLVLRTLNRLSVRCVALRMRVISSCEEEVGRAVSAVSDACNRKNGHRVNRRSPTDARKLEQPHTSWLRVAKALMPPSATGKRRERGSSRAHGFAAAIFGIVTESPNFCQCQISVHIVLDIFE
jgi:hypothetical protein